MITKFNPEGKEVLTYGECLHPAMKITEEADAQQYLKDYAAFIQKAMDKHPRDDDKTAEDVAKINLGYFAGYYDLETMRRVERLFNCAHPVFGKTTETGISASKAYNMGLRAGAAS